MYKPGLWFIALAGVMSVSLLNAADAPPAPAATAPAATPPAVTAVTAPGTAAATPATSAKAASRVVRAQDRVDLDTTQITGNRELPKVMYVVPWKRPDMGDYAGKPPNSLLDEVLQPVEREVFKRQNRYFSALRPDENPAAATPEAAGAAVSGGVEK